MEANYARYLQYLQEEEWILSWEHEPKTFWFEGIKRGVCSYKPDFRVRNLDGGYSWVEVKGYMDAKSKTKIKRFGTYFPKEVLIVIGKEWFRAHGNLKFIIKEWE